MRSYLAPNADATLSLGKAIGGLLAPGDFLALIGDLGAGKTTLTQGIALGLGIDQPVISPTFTLLAEYPASVPLYHFDLYRLQNAGELLDIGFDEYLQRAGVVIVEWADRAEEALPPEMLTIHITDAARAGNRERGRRIDLIPIGNRARDLADRLSTDTATVAMRFEEIQP